MSEEKQNTQQSENPSTDNNQDMKDVQTNVPPVEGTVSPHRLRNLLVGLFFLIFVLFGFLVLYMSQSGFFQESPEVIDKPGINATDVIKETEESPTPTPSNDVDTLESELNETTVNDIDEEFQEIENDINQL